MLMGLPIDLEITGIDYEANSSVAIIRSGPTEDTYSEGDYIGENLAITSITRRSVIVTDLQNGTSRELFLYGGAAIGTTDARKGNERRDSTVEQRLGTPQPAALSGRQQYTIPAQNFLPIVPAQDPVKSLSETQFIKSSENVVKVQSQDDVVEAGLPQTIYLNKSGDQLYTDEAKIGIPADSVPFYQDGEIQGIQLGFNSPNSVLGGFGLSAGDVIQLIDGHYVTSMDEVTRLLRTSEGNIVRVAYRNKDKIDYIYEKYTMILRTAGQTTANSSFSQS